MEMAGKEPPNLREHFRQASGTDKSRTRGRDRDRDPELER
jgi:hypothetical protein